MDLNVDKYTTTQEIFLSKVGITNNYQEDNLNLTEPFFVRYIESDHDSLGETRNPVCFYQKELIVLCVYL